MIIYDAKRLWVAGYKVSHKQDVVFFIINQKSINISINRMHLQSVKHEPSSFFLNTNTNKNSFNNFNVILWQIDQNKVYNSTDNDENLLDHSITPLKFIIKHQYILLPSIIKWQAFKNWEINHDHRNEKMNISKVDHSMTSKCELVLSFKLHF